MKNFKISMKGYVNEIETTFNLEIDFTEKQLQQFVVQQALLEAEHKGFENVTILDVEEQKAPEYVQMKLFPDEPEEQPHVAQQDQPYQTYGNPSNTDRQEDQDLDEEPSEEDTMDDEDCCDSEGNCSSNYTPYTSSTGQAPPSKNSTYTAYAPNPTGTTAPKSYHVKLGNDYAPYRSYRINISTTKDIS